MSNPTALEKLTGSLPVQVALTATAAASGTLAPIAALLPVLANSLAAGRQSRRVEAELAMVNSELERQAELVKTLSDDQYKLVLEVLSTLLSTTNTAKLQLLRLAISNIVRKSDIQSRDSALLSRLIRDISAEEVRFVLDNFQHRYIAVTANPCESDVIKRIERDSEEGRTAIALITLSVLIPMPQPNNTQFDTYEFAPIVAKLASLFQQVEG